jgi:hypothetical protein
MDLGVQGVFDLYVLAILIECANDRVWIIQFSRFVRKIERVQVNAQVFDPSRDIGNREGSNAAPDEYVK